MRDLRWRDFDDALVLYIRPKRTSFAEQGLRYVEKEKKKKGLFVFLFLRIWTRLYRKSLSDSFSGFTKPGWKRLLSKDIDKSVNNGKLRKEGI